MYDVLRCMVTPATPPTSFMPEKELHLQCFPRAAHRRRRHRSTPTRSRRPRPSGPSASGACACRWTAPRERGARHEEPAAAGRAVRVGEVPETVAGQRRCAEASGMVPASSEGVLANVGKTRVGSTHGSSTIPREVALSSDISRWPRVRAGERAGAPNGIRIRAAGLKGRCPRPLDDGGSRAAPGIIPDARRGESALPAAPGKGSGRLSAAARICRRSPGRRSRPSLSSPGSCTRGSGRRSRTLHLLCVDPR